jgi:hypothetical protein
LAGWQQDEEGSENTADLSEMRVRRGSPTPGARDAFVSLKNSLSGKIIDSLDPELDLSDAAKVRPYVQHQIDVLLERSGTILNRSEKRQLVEAIVADLNQLQSK